jgi:holo-[acyl-carrier protein] synthase
MILGIGNDIVDVERIEKIVGRHADAFLEKIFTPSERAEAKRRNERPEYYAGRWAIKEAVAKALGHGIGEKCGWLDVETLGDSVGRPRTRLSGCASETAARLGVETVHVSLSHDRKLACAFVVVEGERRP